MFGIKKARTWDGQAIWIRINRHGLYLAYSSWLNACLNRVSPSLMHDYDQFTLQQAWVTGFIISK